MALKDLFNLIDNKLADVFHTKPHDPVKARKPVVAGIERTRTQFMATEPSKAPNKWWKVNNNVVEFTAKPGGQVLQINGQDTNYIPSERFGDFLTAFEHAVNAGEFDKELEEHGKGNARVSGASRRGTISPEAAAERGRRAAATRAANKAKAAAGK